MNFQNTEAIFEIIGNEPVLDQFDILYTNLLADSSTDNYITGSLLTRVKTTTNKSTYVIGTRGKVFSKLGIRGATPHQDPLDAKRSYNLQPWRERAGTVRTLKIFSNTERYYDSLLPNLSKMLAAYEIDVAGVSDSAFNLFGCYATIKSSFLFRFPFSEKFSDIPRAKLVSQGIVSNTGVPIAASSLLLEFPIDYVFSQNAGEQHNPIYVVSHSPDYIANQTPVNYAPATSDVSKIIFGFGDWNSYPKGYGYGFPDFGYNKYPIFKSGSIDAGTLDNRACGPIIRGWKYGVHDASPHYTSCIFRRDRFGQLRDMLEQRHSPVSYLDSTNFPTQNLGDFESPAMPTPEFATNLSVGKNFENTIEYPVKVSFVKQEVVNKKLIYKSGIQPSDTWSSNLSNYATSSLPFFDLDNASLGRNRQAIPDYLLFPIDATVTTGA